VYLSVADFRRRFANSYIEGKIREGKLHHGNTVIYRHILKKADRLDQRILNFDTDPALAGRLAAKTFSVNEGFGVDIELFCTCIQVRQQLDEMIARKVESKKPFEMMWPY